MTDWRRDPVYQPDEHLERSGSSVDMRGNEDDSLAQKQARPMPRVVAPQHTTRSQPAAPSLQCANADT